MTLRLVEGFETDQSVSYLAAKYANRPTSVTPLAGRRFGTSIQGITLVTFPLVSSPLPGWVNGIGWRTGANPDVTTDYIAFHLSGVSQVAVHLRSDRRLEVRRGSTVLETASAAQALPDLDWAYVEFRAVVHPSAGSYEVRVNKITILSGSGLNTADSGTANADVVKVASNSNNFLDDWYVLDTSGGERNDFLGPQVVEGLLPSGNGFVQDFSPSSGMDHVVLVDDPASALDPNDYVESSVDTDEELFEFEDLRFIKGGITGVAVNTVTGLSGVGTRTIRGRYRSTGGSSGSSPAYTVVSPASENRQGIFEQDPTGPDTWSAEDVNTGQFGVEVVS